ncbi:MAG: D-aminoacylase [Gemmatimonadota bacterium]|nr:D-aminoacylase [Gemmatimonadota bacterium]
MNRRGAMSRRGALAAGAGRRASASGATPRSRPAGLVFAALGCLALSGCGDTPGFDLVLAGGTVVDGTGAPGVSADVGVVDGRIAEVGDLAGRTATRRVDVSGHVVAPGFIDPHTHSRGLIFEIPTADNFILQGVTTLVEGNDGSSPLPVGPFLDSLERHTTAPNFALFVGHGTIRSEVLGSEDRVPTSDEMERMKGMVARGMADGALGLSTGLFYLPGSFSTTEEVIELARVAAAAGGIYISHMRNEDVRVLNSVEETIRIGREAGIPVQMTHHKVGGHDQFGLSAESIRMMREARAEGVDVTFDQYPYTASSTSLSSIIPRWAQEGDRLEERAADPATRRRIVDDIEAFVEMRFASDAAKIQLTRCDFDDGLAGSTLADVLESRGVAATPDAIADLILEFDAAGGCGAIFHAFSEEDVEAFLRSEYGMIGSDGSLVRFGEASPHPRGYGTFPRVLGRYVRERGVISLEEAVRRMTSAPADRLGFTERGRIAERMVADLVVIDPATVADRATFEDPHQYPVGIPWVFVAGVAVVEEGAVTGARPGVVLRGAGWN